METQIIEHKVLIAKRVPPGDRWSLIDYNPETVHESLTDALEEYFQQTQEKCHFRLEPLNGKLFALKESEEEIPEEPTRLFNIYGDY